MLLIGELNIPLHLEARAILCHVLLVQHHMGVAPADGAPQNRIRHVRRALGVLDTVCGQAPAHECRAAVQTVLLVDQPAHVAIGHARGILAEAPENHVGEMAVRIWRRAVMQLVRPEPVAAAHLGHDGLECLGHARGQAVVVGLVARVVLDHAAVGRLDQHHLDPAPIPKLGQAQLLVGAVVPARFFHRPAARILACIGQARGTAALVGQPARIALLPPGGAIAATGQDQLARLRKCARDALRMQPFVPLEIPRVAQVPFLRRPIPTHLATAHDRAFVAILCWIAHALNAHAAKAHGSLGPEGIAAGIVGMGLALGLVQFDIERVGHVLATRLAVGRDPPVRARGLLVARERAQRGADAVFNGWRDALLLHGVQQLGVQLLAVGIVHLLVGRDAPWRLLVHLAQPFRVFVERYLALTHAQIIIPGVQRTLGFGRVHVHRAGVDQLSLQSVSSGSSYSCRLLPGSGMPWTKVIATASPLSGERPKALRMSSFDSIWIAATRPRVTTL